MNINIRNVRLKKGEEIADWLVSLTDTGDCYSSRPTVPSHQLIIKKIFEKRYQ